MFRIETLTLIGKEKENVYRYEFSDGINYFRGKNDSGKTEFYMFLDYMFGANEDLSRKEWFKDSLISAEMEFSLDNRKFVVSRYLTEINRNYIRYCDEENGEALRPEEYREKLNIIFGRNIEVLKELREYVEEAISYRTFTLFNFLGEKRQGVLNNFFDKCSKIEYAINGICFPQKQNRTLF